MSRIFVCTLRRDRLLSSSTRYSRRSVCHTRCVCISEQSSRVSRPWPRRRTTSRLDSGELAETTACQELRIALPGVQILFAFLLVVPFNNRFAETDDLQRNVWFAAFLLALGAVACFIAPIALYHRIRFRDFDKERLITTATRTDRRRPRVPRSRHSPRPRSSSRGSCSATSPQRSSRRSQSGTMGGLWFALPILRKVRS